MWYLVEDANRYHLKYELIAFCTLQLSFKINVVPELCDKQFATLNFIFITKALKIRHIRKFWQIEIEVNKTMKVAVV